MTNVSDAELAALHVLWERGPSRVRDVLEELPEDKWAYTTVQTLLHRLEDKGVVRREKGRGATIYEAAVSRDDFLRGRLDDLSQKLAGGSVVPLLHGIVSGRTLDAGEIAEMRSLLDDLEESAKPKRRRNER